ncbi:MAG: hypothetical protein NC548_48795 [Lachnospiraceae bacterium]|nr:hypothetical protein [Lachnospiraceae bacterium]
MVTVLFFLAFILLFVGTIVLVQFPEVATEIYEVISIVIEYVSKGSGIVWFFLPKTLTLIVLGIVLAVEVIMRGLHVFLWIYDHLKQ